MWMSERWREAGSWREWRSRWEVGASRVGLQVRKSRLWTSTIKLEAISCFFTKGKDFR